MSRAHDLRVHSVGSTPAQVKQPVGFSVRALVTLLRFYKLYVSPLLGNRCRFYPSCSTYMHECLMEHGALRGLPMGGMRLLRCHPFHPGGVDLPPKRLESQRGFIIMDKHHHG